MSKDANDQTDLVVPTVRITVTLPRTEADALAAGSFTLTSAWQIPQVNAAAQALRTVQAAAKRALGRAGGAHRP